MRLRTPLTCVEVSDTRTTDVSRTALRHAGLLHVRLIIAATINLIAVLSK
jgi:hypothetical protein